MRKAIVTAAILGSIISAGVASAATSDSLSANAAVLVNHGQQAGDNCSASVGASVYTGFISHIVVTPSGNVNVGCQLWGPPVGSVMDFNGLRIDPSGHAVLSQNGA